MYGQTKTQTDKLERQTTLRKFMCKACPKYLQLHTVHIFHVMNP